MGEYEARSFSKRTKIVSTLVIIGIFIALIFAPTLSTPRYVVNEWNAITSLKSYAAVQSVFKKVNYSKLLDSTKENWYCEDFEKLYSLEIQDTYNNEPDIRSLALISKATTPALEAEYKYNNEAHFREVALISKIMSKATTPANDYQGYYFRQGNMTMDGFELYAIPCEYGKSGYNTFYINQDGKIYGKDFGGMIVPVGARPDKTWFTP